MSARGWPALLLLSAVSLQGAVTVERFRPHDFSFSAQVAGNPFEVELHGEFTGPDGARLRVPGFYDGGTTWKIRFMAPTQGAWQMRTVSPVAALNGKTEEITATPGKLRGRLRIDADHPYHFIFEDGTRFFLMGYEADWLGIAGLDDPERSVMHRTIAHMDARGFNYVLVNVYAHDTRWAPGKSCEYDHGPPAMYAFGGTNDKPDHTRLNTAFFQKYDSMMNALLDKGIVAHMMIKVYNKNVNWPAPGSEEERRYFRYVVARYQAYPNLVFDFSKESYNERNEELQHSLLNLVRSEDAYQHLVTAHDDDRYEWDPVLGANLDFRIDQQHSDYPEAIRFDRAMRARPVVNAEFGYEYGVEPLPTHKHVNQSDWKEFLRRAWTVYFAGGYGVYYYNNTAWDVLKPDPEPPGMQRWELLKKTFTSLPYWRLAPCDELAFGGPAMCESGRFVAAYVPGRTVAVNLRGMNGPVKAKWLDTWTGAERPIEALAPAAHKLNRPKEFGDAPAVLIVTPENQR